MAMKHRKPLAQKERPSRKAVIAVSIAVASVATAIASVGLAGAADSPRVTVARQMVQAFCTDLADDTVNSRQRTLRADLCAMWKAELDDALTVPPTTTPPATTPPATTPPATTSPPTTPPVTTPPPTTPPATTPPVTTPPPTTPPPTTGFPDASNTGVPVGVTLTAYSGPCNITAANTAIDSKLINCDLTINAFGVVITNSRVNGQITMGNGALTISDSEIVVGARHGLTGLSNHDWVATRVEISGGNRGALCDNNCTLRDSWIHGTYVENVDHASGARVSQNANYIHNTLACDATPTPQDGGCSADLTMYPDYAPVKNILIQNNLLVANTGNAFCAYGGYIPSKPFGGDPTNATNIRFIGNVFQRGSNGQCAAYGPIDSWGKGRTGNVWSGNIWDNGTALPEPN